MAKGAGSGASLAKGARLGPYEIVAPLGSGGMGEVYRARDTRLGRDVALKILPAEFAGDPVRAARLEQEARAVAALNHPNIVAVYDVGPGYTVSELVDGESLRGAKFSLRKTIEIAAQIASGLAAAHEAGIVHRDLKPENVLLTREGRAKILDFGLARKMHAPEMPGSGTISVQTEAGVVMGTMGYISPEQVAGKEADHRSDIFSFGALLYEMLSGRRAFPGETSVDAMQAILRQEPPDLPLTVPAGVRQVVAHCLEKDPAQRFQSARDLGFALAALAQSDTRTQPLPALEQDHAKRRRRWLWLGGAAAALLLLALGAARLLTRVGANEGWSAVRLGGPEIAMVPRLSPDGHLLAFLAMVDGLNQVALMKPESGNWNVLTHHRDHGLIHGLSWSADGAQIYFDRSTDVPLGIYSVPVLGGDERLLLENAAYPAALPDGTLLVMRRNANRELQWFHYWPETGKLEELPALPDLVHLSPEVQPLNQAGHVALGGSLPGDKLHALAWLDVDIVKRTARPLPSGGYNLAAIRCWTLAPGRASILAAVQAETLVRIVSIPIDGAPPRSLFTSTNDVWWMNAAQDSTGAVLLQVTDRPVHVIRLGQHGDAQPMVGFSQAPDLPMLAALPDGRVLTVVSILGRTRLMAIEAGKDPAPLINTSEETAAPMTPAGDRRVAFMTGAAPRQTIAIADTSNGRILDRISPGKGEILSLAASPDGATLYFAAGGSIWSIASTGGAVTRIGAGDGVAAHPDGTELVIVRHESSRTLLFRVPSRGGQERPIVLDKSAPPFSYISPGAIRRDGRMLLSLNVPDSWFNPLAILDMSSGRITRLAGDRVSDLPSAAWLPNGSIAALRLGMASTIWRFHPDGR